MCYIDWETIGNLSTLLGLLSAAFAFFAWIQAKKISKDTKAEKERLNQEVFVVLHAGEEDKIVIPFSLRRGEITRSEILGLIGMLPMAQGKERERFKNQFLSTARFRQVMSAIQDADGKSQLLIQCSKNEVYQFNRKKIDNSSH